MLLVVRRPRGTGLLVVAGLVFPVLYTVSTYTWLNTEPRYLSFFWPVVALLVAVAAQTPLRTSLIVVASLALAIAGLARIEHGDLAAQHADGAAVPADLRPLLATLRAHRIDRVYANYWIAFPITFESRERIIAATVNDLSGQRYRVRDDRLVPIVGTNAGSNGRYPAYAREVAASRDVAHVFVAGARGASRCDRVSSARLPAAQIRRLHVYLPPPSGGAGPGSRAGTT